MSQCAASISPETIELLTCKAMLHYQNRQYDEAERAADDLLRQLPHDMVALYVKGAVRLRLSKPGDLRLREALTCWSEAMEDLDEADALALSETIEHELSRIMYGSINRAATYWRTYENAHFANELVALFTTFEQCERECATDDAFHPRVASLIKRIAAHDRRAWIALVLGVDMAAPLESTPLRLKGYADVLSCMAAYSLVLLDQVQDRDDTVASQSKLVAKRAFDAFRRFSARHEKTLSSDQKELLEQIGAVRASLG